jgi:hypothetical protein
MTENREQEQIRVLEERLGELERITLEDREARFQGIERNLRTVQRQERRQQGLLLSLAVATLVGLAGMKYQDGKFSWLLDTEKTRELVELLAPIVSTLGVGAGLTMAVRSTKDPKPSAPEPAEDPEA